MLIIVSFDEYFLLWLRNETLCVLYLQGYHLTMAHISIDITDVMFLTFCCKVLITCMYILFL